MHFKVYSPAAAATSEWFADRCNSIIILKYTNMGVYLFTRVYFYYFMTVKGKKETKNSS